MGSSGFNYTPSVISKMAVGYVGTTPVPPPELGLNFLSYIFIFFYFFIFLLFFFFLGWVYNFFLFEK
jgi:hypothetical protein